jgi:hypothetical protein
MKLRLLIPVLWLSSLLLSLGLPVGSAQELELSIVVHRSKASVAGSLSSADLQAIFTRKKQFWGDGSKITPLNLAKASPGRELFDRAVLGLDPQAVARFWIDQQIRGAARAPAEVASPELALRTLRVMKDAICYVPSNLSDADALVVARVRGGKVVMEK